MRKSLPRSKIRDNPKHALLVFRHSFGFMSAPKGNEIGCHK